MQNKKTKFIRTLKHSIDTAYTNGNVISFTELIEILELLKKLCLSQHYIDILILCTQTHINQDLKLNKTLTQREESIVLLIGKGQSTTTISKILNISRYTVESHRKNIRKKLKHQKSLDLSVFSFLYLMQYQQLNGKDVL